MPSPFSGIIQDMRARRGQDVQQSDMMMRMIDQQRRAQEAEQFRLWMMQNGPAQQKERRLAAHQKLIDAQKLSWSKYALTMDESEVPIEQRAKFRNLQKVIATDPVLYADVAQRLVQQMRPHTIQKLTSQTLDDEGNAINTYEIYDPNNPGIGSMSGFGGASIPPSSGGGGGPRPSVAAPTRLVGPKPKTTAERLADHFVGTPEFGGAPSEAPPPAPEGAGPPSVPGWED